MAASTIPNPDPAGSVDEALDARAYAQLVEHHRAAIVDATRHWVAGQASLWAHVPFWAGMADGRGGWNEDLRLAREHGLWRLNAGTRALVDCGSGQLVQLPIPLDEDRSPARDGAVLAVAGGDGLDAEAVLAGLRQRALSDQAVTGDDPDPRHHLELIAGGLTPTWRCAERCPTCPEARFNATLVALAGRWQGSLGDLLETARAVARRG